MTSTSTTQVKLEIFSYANDGTYGYITLPSGIVLATVERPWLDNAPSVSCIPIGTYICKPRRYFRGDYDAIEITDVKGRSYILFHVGNYVHNSKGCILINTDFGWNDGKMCGISSTSAFSKFMEELGNSEFELVITNKEGGIL